MSEEFLREIIEECRHGMDDAEDGNMRLLALTEVLLGRLEQVGQIAPPNVAHYVDVRGRIAAEVHGYANDHDNETLQLFFIVDETATDMGPHPSVRTTPTHRLETAFRRMEGFVERALENRITNVDESDPVHELLQLILDSEAGDFTIEMYVLTTGKCTFRNQTTGRYARQVYDIVGLERICGSNVGGLIEVNFEADHGGGLPCLVMPPTTDGIQVFLTYMPGDVLAAIYKEHRAALLERNVRCFLQLRGKVNKGIRETLLGQPEMLLPYNNGLSATAGGVELQSSRDGHARILSVSDFQVVNGGQTTATIAHCVTRDKADLSTVRVAMKLSVVPPDQIDSIVPQISRCANTQNKVQDADFSANDPWHITMEKLSRDTWTTPNRDSPRGTQWFYERANGQYNDELARCNTPAAKKTFRKEKPSKQKITKTDVAKYLLGWDQQPAQVALGAQRAFAKFMKTKVDDWPASGEIPDANAFKKVVALAILHKHIERLHGAMGFQGYRSQAVAYSVAKLSQIMGKEIDSMRIWREQRIPDQMDNALRIIVQAVRDKILDTPQNYRNISEWCKKEACWTAISRLELRLQGLPQMLRTERNVQGVVEESTDNSADETGSDSSECDVIRQVPAKCWFDLSSWAKKNDFLRPWQRGLAYSLGRLATINKPPSVKQVDQGLKLLTTALELGYKNEALPQAVIDFVED